MNDQNTSTTAVNLSPENWASDVRTAVEEHEGNSWLAGKSRTVFGQDGFICTTASPIALQAGLSALRAGGTAADATAIIALTQVSTELGSVVSYGGIMSLVYYDVTSKRITSLDAGFNSYQNETNPSSIPACGRGSAIDQPGRQTLVPGFMAGIDALHKRFGKLPYASLFQPAIWYAENGIKVNSILAYYFQSRKKDLARTEEGREFLRQAGNELPVTGNLFVQRRLAETLRATSQRGAGYFYTGRWAKDFVELVTRYGGKVSMTDLANYKAEWTTPQKTEVFGHTVYCPGLPSTSSYLLFPALHLFEELKIAKRGEYWQDPLVLRDIQRIFDLTDFAPWLAPSVKKFFESKKIDYSDEAQLSREYATKVAPFLEEVWNSSGPPKSNHSDSIVVIDKFGNIAATTHTINTNFWGDTGIVVDGVPLPDAAGFQQLQLAGIKPGARLPSGMAQTICFLGDKPVLATAGIGASLIPETVRLLTGVLGKGMEIEAMQSAAPLIYNYVHPFDQRVPERGIVVPKDRYDEAFRKRLGALVEKVHFIDNVQLQGLRGTVTSVSIDQQTGRKRSAETEDMLIFAEAE